VKTASAKSKGRNHQKAVRDALLRAFPDLGPDDITSRSMGARGEDLILSPAARRRLPVSFECKDTRRTPGAAAIAQARANAGPHVPVVAWHPPRHAPDYVLVTLTLGDLLRLLGRHGGAT
jgi:hypothetical protein